MWTDKVLIYFHVPPTPVKTRWRKQYLKISNSKVTVLKANHHCFQTFLNSSPHLKKSTSRRNLIGVLVWRSINLMPSLEIQHDEEGEKEENEANGKRGGWKRVRQRWKYEHRTPKKKNPEIITFFFRKVLRGVKFQISWSWRQTKTPRCRVFINNSLKSYML